MSKPKIVYFQTRGRAEVARMVMAAAGVEWDEEYVTGETMPQWKESGRLAYGQVPLLVDGDLELVQSGAISRYLARKYDLYGDLQQGTVAEMLMDGWTDLLGKVIPLIFPIKKEEELAAFAKDVAPGKLAQFEELVKKNLGDKQFLGGDSIVLADLVVFLMGEGFMEGMGWAKRGQYMHHCDLTSTQREDIPTIAALYDRVGAVDNVAAYVASDKRHPQRKL